jgi:hypothetical protein
MVEALQALGMSPVTSDKSRGVWHLQASPLNHHLYELVKPDIVISLVTEQAGRFWDPLLRRCSTVALILVVVSSRPLYKAAQGTRKAPGNGGKEAFPQQEQEQEQEQGQEREALSQQQQAQGPEQGSLPKPGQAAGQL